MTLDPKALEAAEDTLWHRTETGGRADLEAAIETFLSHPDCGWVERRKYDDMVRTALRDNDEARREAERANTLADCCVDERDEAYKVAKELGKQIAALREALEELLTETIEALSLLQCPGGPPLNDEPVIIKANAALTDTAKAAEGWVRVDEDAKQQLAMLRDAGQQFVDGELSVDGFEAALTDAYDEAREFQRVLKGWQLMPPKLTDEMRMILFRLAGPEEHYANLLAAAPNPEAGEGAG